MNNERLTTQYAIRYTQYAVLCIAFFFLSSSVSLADAIPTAEDINSLAEIVKLTTDTFMQESLRLRLGFEFSGRFLTSDDRNNLHKLAKRAGERLQAIAGDQRQLKQQIEDYQGRDWDDRYGASGLWRKLLADIYITRLGKCEIDYYLALTAKQPERSEILHRILARIDSLDTIYRSADSQLLRAAILALFARTDSAYKPLAIEQFDLLMARSDMRHSTVFKIAIERIKLLGRTKPDRLNTLAKELAQSSCADELELVLSLAFLQRRYAPEAFEKTVQTWPQIEDFLGSLILSQLSSQIEAGQPTLQGLQQISVFEAELAAQTAWRNNAREHKRLLECLSGTGKFQTPLILYTAAAASAEASPTRAVNLLIKASRLQLMQKNDKLEIEAYSIAEHAAQLSYNLFVQDSSHCSVTLKAFENYFAIAGERIDEELQYLYVAVLDNCGLSLESKGLLEKIADRPTGNYRRQAKLQLIVGSIRQGRHENLEQKSKLIRQFSSLIPDGNDCEYADEAMELLSEVVDRIDQLEFQVDDFNKMIQDYKNLAEFGNKCLNDFRTALLLAEISVFAANKDKEKLSAAEKLLGSIAQDGDADDVDLLRCRARLSGEQKKFSEAAGLWARIARIRKSKSPLAGRRSWKWWRARFYELYCWSKMSRTQKEDVLHTIEVLENSFQDIPPLWAEKLSLLKQQCRSRLTGKVK